MFFPCSLLPVTFAKADHFFHKSDRIAIYSNPNESMRDG